MIEMNEDQIMAKLREEGWKSPEEVKDIFYYSLDISKPCPRCGGRGKRVYRNTSAWHYGAGGNMATTDICDACWGSGDKDHPGINLRVLEKILTEEQKTMLTKQRERDRSLKDR